VVHVAWWSFMKPTIVIAILLIVLGVFVFAYHGFNYTTTEKAIDLGPIQVTAEKTHSVSLPPVVGGIALVGGILLLITARKRA
jgi:hypothetical protein